MLKNRKMREKRYIASCIILTLFFSLALMSTIPLTFADPWWTGNRIYRKQVVVNSTLVNSDLSDFPVLVDVTDSDLASKSKNDGTDIAFADTSGILLDYEIESYNSTDGHLIAWVRIPNLSSSVDTTFYLYYGYGGAAGDENAAGVWSSNYIMVHHLEEETGNASDSSQYDNFGVTTGGLDLNVTGKINGAAEFDDTNRYLEVSHSAEQSGFSTGFTISAWIKQDDNLTRQSLIQKYDINGDQRGWMLDFQNHSTYGPVLGLYQSQNGTDFVYSLTPFNHMDGEFYHVSVVWTNGTVPLWYVNGSLATRYWNGNVTSIYNNTVPIHVGISTSFTGREFNGILDEIQLANVSRTADWIATEYASQNAPSTFLSLGSEESSVIYYITASSGAGGSISPTGQNSVPEAFNKTFYLMPDDGYHISDIIVDSVSQGADYSYTFTNVTQNHTISATFEVTTPPAISLDKSSYEKLETVQISISGGTAGKSIMLQINNPSGTPVWAYQDNFDSNGDYSYQIKIPSSWAYGNYPLRIRDVDAGTTKSATIKIQSAAPPPPPPPPPCIFSLSFFYFSTFIHHLMMTH